MRQTERKQKGDKHERKIERMKESETGREGKRPQKVGKERGRN